LAENFGKRFWQKIGVFSQNKAKLCENWIITLVFEKNANFFAENWQKSQKIVIITSTPGLKMPELRVLYWVDERNNSDR
jgi:hypothetical protein